MASAGRVLIIAGSDSGGGAGVQADIKTVTMLGGYAATAITALTAQNTTGVHGVHAVPAGFVADQIRVVMEDIGADAIKIGMLGATETVHAVVGALEAHAPGVPVVLDPVMVAKGGQALLADDAVEAMKTTLLPRAGVVTPNAPEAARLTGLPVVEPEDLAAAGRALLDLGARAGVMKGGHLPGDLVTDVVVTADGTETFTETRIDTRHTHGTGCTLASAIAVGLAQGLDIISAVKKARAYVFVAMANAPGLGAGHGPLDHGWPLRVQGG